MSLSLYLELNRKKSPPCCHQTEAQMEELDLLRRCRPKDEGLLLKKQVEKTFLKQNKQMLAI
jgi:hypothetical protein